jgi:hypothetical protein
METHAGEFSGTRNYIRYPKNRDGAASRGNRGSEALCAQITDIFSPYLSEASDGRIIALQTRPLRILENRETVRNTEKTGRR